MKINLSYLSEQNVQRIKYLWNHYWGLMPLCYALVGAGIASCWFPVWTTARKQDLCIQRREDAPFYERMDTTDHIRLYTNIGCVDAPSQTYKAKLELGPFLFVSMEDEPRDVHA